MESHFKLDDLTFETLLKRGTLDPGLFGHEAHLRLAWICIQQYGLEEANNKIQVYLKNYVAALGVAEKYNATLTIAAVHAVHHFMKRSRADNFKSFLIEFPRLKTNFKDLLAQHYSFDIFTSNQAKKEYLEPDLLAFD